LVGGLIAASLRDLSAITSSSTSFRTLAFLAALLRDAATCKKP